MRILIAGKSGQVARSLEEQLQHTAHSWVAIGRPVLDLADPETIAALFNRDSFDVVINAAAYTAVDQAESEEDVATAINGAGAAALARFAATYNCPIIHLSTDYVFDGTSPEPYAENQPVAPLGAYGRSKLAGEQGVAAANPEHVILRTAWVYSPFGKNFVKTMLRLAETREELSVVADQFGSPTYAIDIADAVIEIVDQLDSSNDRIHFPWGVYHLAGSEFANWADVAETALVHSAALGGPTATINRIPSSEFPTPTQRPANSRLNTDLLYRTFNIRLPVWSERVKACTERLLRDGIED